jgi:outer membrane protein OmpA-like peptidoglycan-associated protein
MVCLIGHAAAGETLQHGDFSNSDLQGHDFSNANLVSIDFSNSKLDGANFEGANLVGVDFSNADLNGANFKGANMQGVDFSNTELRKACLIDAKLVGVDFSNADLSMAVMTGHKNLGTDFSNATTAETVWKGTRTCPGKRSSLARPTLTTAQTIEKALSAGHNAKVDLTVNFDFNSDKILGAARAQVLEIAKALKSEVLQADSITIEGHTDNTGADDYNMDLSYRRAISVMRALSEEYQVDANRLQVRGHGETQPVATNETDNGRALNRRVTLVNTGG